MDTCWFSYWVSCLVLWNTGLGVNLLFNGFSCHSSYLDLLLVLCLLIIFILSFYTTILAKSATDETILVSVYVDDSWLIIGAIQMSVIFPSAFQTMRCFIVTSKISIIIVQIDGVVITSAICHPNCSIPNISIMIAGIYIKIDYFISIVLFRILIHWVLLTFSDATLFLRRNTQIVVLIFVYFVNNLHPQWGSNVILLYILPVEFEDIVESKNLFIAFWAFFFEVLTPTSPVVLCEGRLRISLSIPHRYVSESGGGVCFFVSLVLDHSLLLVVVSNENTKQRSILDRLDVNIVLNQIDNLSHHFLLIMFPHVHLLVRQLRFRFCFAVGLLRILG